MQETYRDELRTRYEALTAKADSQNSRAAAIRLHCIECAGGEVAEVRRCTVVACFLWPYRMGLKPLERP